MFMFTIGHRESHGLPRTSRSDVAVYFESAEKLYYWRWIHKRESKALGTYAAQLISHVVPNSLVFRWRK